MATYENDETKSDLPTFPLEKLDLETRPKQAVWSVTLSWEMILWLVFGASAFLSRFFNLGARVMSHDESLHVFYSWQLSKGSGYAHNPMMHGPFLFEATAFFNLLFGANDFTSRLVPALLGIGIVIGVPLLLRPWLGRAGALMAALFFLVSPYVLYYSRYNRHDIQVIVWVLLAVFAMLAYLRERREGRLILLAAALALMFSTFEISFIYLAIFASFLIVRMVVVYGLHWKEWLHSAEWDILVVVSTLGAFFSAPIALLALNPIWTRLTGQPFVDFKILGDYGANWASGPAGLRLWGLMAVFWVAAAIVGYAWGRFRWLKLAGLFLGITIPLFTTFFTNWGGIGTGFIGSLGYWLSQHDVQRGSQPLYYYLIVFPIYEYLPLLLGLAALVFFAIRRRNLPELARVFVPLAGWWAMLMFIGLTLAGEKMPWLSTHLTVPFILLAAWLAGRVAARAWREIAEGQRSVSWQTLGAIIPIAVLLLMTARTSYLVNYINYDYTTEFIGYAHGAPGVKWAIEDIEQIANRLGQGQSMQVAYDSEVSWPMSWYLRNYPGFFGDQPNRGALENAPVIVVGSKNWQKVEAYVGGNYNRYEVIRIWWPMEDYRDLNWERIRGALNDPHMRQALWNIFWSRDYSLYAQITQKELNPPVKWPLEDRMRIYIRKDVAAQVLGLNVQGSQLADLPTQETVFVGKQVGLKPKQVLALPDLSGPRNLVTAPDGTTYLLDTGNSRILKIDPSGKILTSWGSRTVEGQTPPAAGTFNEPWGIALDVQGNVYVADTWNHRIQKFDAEGKFLLEWGTGGMSTDGTDRFWGPRGVAVSPEGNVYVTDTGNRRVSVFGPQGEFLFVFDQQGEAQLDEPVGITIGADGHVFVADTWNKRVAVFSLQGEFERSWPVAGWNSASIDNKPYLAVDGQDRVYLTDPEGYRILVYSMDGTPLAAYGQFGVEEDALNLPTGISVSTKGEVWIADAANNRLAIYPPITP